MKIIALRNLVYFALLLTLYIPNKVDAQVIVQTFLDANNNGVQDPGEDLVTGLTVTATDANGNEFPLLDDGNGTFILPSELIFSRLRIKVTGYSPGMMQGVAGPTSVFYVVDGDTVLVPVSPGPNVSVETSKIMIPCYDGGPAEGNQGPAFVSFPYNVDGIAQSKGGSEVDPDMDATIEQIGSAWGVAYQNTLKRAFTSAVLKRHVGLGPEGTGGLYMIDYASGSPVVTGFNLQGIVPSEGPAIDLGSVLRENVTGDVDASMPYALTSAPNTASYDMDAFAKIGATAFGDIDVEEDERTLWMVNLKQRSLIAMDVAQENLVPGTQNIRHYPISNMTGLPNLNYRYAMCINAGGNLNNTGAEPFTDQNAVAWDKNKYSESGEGKYSAITVANLLNNNQNTSERPLYRTYRVGEQFWYRIPAPIQETYTVTLHFAEPNNYVAGDRVFRIKAEGQVIEDSYDIVQAAGGNKTAVTLTFEVPVNDGTVDIEFEGLSGAKTNKALVSGVEVVGQSIMESGVLRPWGLTFHEGFGYLGVVADASISQSREHLFGFVLRFDPQDMASGFTEVLAFPLGYPRERASNAHIPQPQPLRSAEWQAWISDWSSTAFITEEEQLSSTNALLCSYSQPILSDINFTSDGGITVGLMDRWGHQCGYRNYPADLSDSTLIVAYGPGDILRAFDDNGILRLETQQGDNGVYFRNDDGPSFSGEFFYEDYFVAAAAHHGEISTGGNAILRGTGTVVNTVFNPINVGAGNQDYENDGVYTQGIQFYSTETGLKERAYLFVDQYISGKANGLGDMEFASEFIGGEIGNYVWCDGNGNGIQDAEEFGIDGIMLTLHDKEDGDAQVAMTTSANGGQFIFDNLLPNHNYAIRIDLAKLEALGFSGLVPDPDQGVDDELDSDGDPNMLPGFSIAMLTTGPVGENDHSIDFGFLGPQANPCTLFECADPAGMGPDPCADFTLAQIMDCVLPPGIMNTVEVYAGLEDDSLVNPITTFPIRVCGPDSIVYARVSLPGDYMCYSIAPITLSIVDPMGGTMPEYIQLACDMTTVDLPAVASNNGLSYSVIDFFTDMAKTMMIPLPASYAPVSMPDTVYFNATVTGGLDDCPIMGSVIILPYGRSLIEAGADTSVCGMSCLDLTSIGASFMPSGSGATMAEWSTSGTGTFTPSNRFGEATMYCPSADDVLAGNVQLTLTVIDDPCVMVSSQMTLTIMPAVPMLIPGEPDTIPCTHPFAENQAENDTFPTCRMVFDCFDTIVGTVIDYQIIPGDCTTEIIKQIKRTVQFTYDKEDYFCMDTIPVLSLPDTVICPPERDSVYCELGYLKDEYGHPSPWETGFPMADTIPLWPQPPSVCDILVIYKDTEFASDCPMTIKREWFIKNSCTGTFDTCVQWLMVFDTVGPYVTKIDTAAFISLAGTSTHDCYADVYIPPIGFADTCSGVKQVKAMIYNYGTALMTYNSESKCFESHEKFRVPVSEIDFLNGQFNIAYIRYEALDNCHNETVLDSLPVVVVDRVKPVTICDKGLNITVSDSIEWVHAESFNEGTWDNCGISMLLARRTDWATACGVDLCDDLHFLYETEHHDSVWCSRLESDKHINPVEAHYQKAIDWLCSDGQVCSYPLLMGWTYDLIKYATLHCIDHPYPVDAHYLEELLATADYGLTSDEITRTLLTAVIPCVKTYDADSLSAAFLEYINSPASDAVADQLLRDLFHIIFANRIPDDEGIFDDAFGNFATVDIGKQIGGGWSEAVPFCCEDACQEVTVEVLAMDYWCNWSKCWTTVKVEDKTPPEVVCELYDATVTCSAYKQYYAPAIELALQGEFDSLQSVLGRYDKVQKDGYGNLPEKTTYTIYDLTCDSNLVEKDTLVYDEHLGYIWKTYHYYRAEYDLEEYERYNGQVADNCGLVCIEEKPWVNLDHCGNGYIKRVFKFVGQCTDQASGHFADTITKYQTIWITNDCDISKAMFEVPKDTIVYSCGIEYAEDGSGNVAGVLSPEFTGSAEYVFDNDCRLVGIGYYDKVFKIVGGDEACYKVLRTWCFADWCALGEPIQDAWWFDSKYQGKYITCVQKIIVYDSQPPICLIDSIPEEIDAAGCYYNLNTAVVVQDECGLLDYSWVVINTKTSETVASGQGELNSSQSSAFIVTAEDLGQGTYKLKVNVTDECQNESVCDASFVVNANKKPTPVCISSLTAELTPMDTDGDGAIDTAMAVVWANEFNSSSQAACGSSNSELSFRIDRGEGEPALPASTETSLELGCGDLGTQEVRMYVVDESGSWDYCSVLLVVQSNADGCGGGSTGILTGQILTENGEPIEQVDLMVEGSNGERFLEAEDISGTYTLGVAMGVEAFVKPRKNTAPVNGVSTSDLIAIQKDLLGKSQLGSWYKRQAADANNDGKVSAIDLIHLRKLILGMVDELPESDSWRFYEVLSNENFYHIDKMLDNMQANFTGVKIGDVNDSNDPALRSGRSGASYKIAVNREVVNDRITLRASKAQVISGLQFTLEFDPSKVQIVKLLNSGSLSVNEGQVNLLRQAEGWITLAWNSEDGSDVSLSEGEELFSLLVKAEQVDLSESMTISSKITAAELYDRDGTEQGLSLIFENSQFIDQFELGQNVPNPWRHETAIEFTVPEATNTILTIYDVSGRMVKQVNDFTARGTHKWNVRASDLPYSGVYYYKLETNDHTAVRKMILME